MNECLEIAEVMTVDGVQYFRFDPSQLGQLEQLILEHIKPNSVVEIAVYPVH